MLLQYWFLQFQSLLSNRYFGSFRCFHIFPGTLHLNISVNAHPGRITPNGRSSIEVVHETVSCRTTEKSALPLFLLYFLILPISVFQEGPSYKDQFWLIAASMDLRKRSPARFKQKLQLHFLASSCNFCIKISVVVVARSRGLLAMGILQKISMLLNFNHYFL